MTQEEVLQHQQYQPFPKLDTVLVNPDGTMSRPWYRLFIELFIRTGALYAKRGDSAYVQSIATPSGQVQVVDAVTGLPIGNITVVNTPGAPAVPVSLGTSPSVFDNEIGDGTLIVSSGAVDISRDLGLTWYPCSLTGGAIPMQYQDQARVSWFNSTPDVTFLPD